MLENCIGSLKYQQRADRCRERCLWTLRFFIVIDNWRDLNYVSIITQKDNSIASQNAGPNKSYNLSVNIEYTSPRLVKLVDWGATTETRTYFQNAFSIEKEKCPISTEVDVLNLRSEGIGDNGVKSFVYGINNKVISLNLSNNKIGDDGVSALSMASRKGNNKTR